ncbi:type I-E CRISPR-associated protein Cas6/Cse3/CasE [Enterovirga sp.]|uniref:type I-E CRISPR-associated protein Cas6/Cse3/CasE n=1 Tax=Enterovirga sp. TaxID=2026350 RepID=UPI002C7A5FB1|nr:type I-E CRISPR-associated protein Cas6/Cse3/CasE [Enterovirga sp.]HMO28544.1 type I-E CRISPR-associated protein Cas6/Cse3/CasE [Enterovirga sp.]
MTLWLSRIRLRHAPDLAALAGLLLPSEENARIAAAHRLLWSLFADGPDRRRDFLWREDGGSSWQRTTFLVLSGRKPEDRRGLFEIDEPKAFEPALAPGQRLRFRLRASPGAAEARSHGQRGKRIDPLARALRGLGAEVRREQRDTITQRVGIEWVARQGAAAGFRLVEAPHGPLLRVETDRWHILPRDGAKPVRFSSLDLEGELVVEDPAHFLSALGRGFGRAKAFGCGLMLIRRP